MAAKKQGSRKKIWTQVRAGCEQDSRERHAPQEKRYAEVCSRRQGRHGEEPQAGHRDWPIRSSQERRQGSEEEILIGPFGLGSSTPIQCRTPASNERRERQSILIH